MVQSIQLHPFYPIVDDLIWLERLVDWGAKMVQVRMKDLDEQQADEMVRDSLKIIGERPVMLWINDYWQSALRFDAAYVHLGQEDLADADVVDIQKHHIHLGISTHDEAELEIALAARPAYIALGPVFETKLKKMRFAPQGYERLSLWREKIGEIALVAIGGMSLERAPKAFDAGADAVSVVSDVLGAERPQQRVKDWLDFTANFKTD